jgi:hypothetical protein
MTVFIVNVQFELRQREIPSIKIMKLKVNCRREICENLEKNETN